MAEIREKIPDKEAEMKACETMDSKLDLVVQNVDHIHSTVSGVEHRLTQIEKSLVELVRVEERQTTLFNQVSNQQSQIRTLEGVVHQMQMADAKAGGKTDLIARFGWLAVGGAIAAAAGYFGA